MNKRMGSIARVCLLSLGAVLCADTDEVSRRVTQLGAESFAEREAASLALWTLGEASLAELRVAAKSPDPEVRLRAAELVEQIELGMRPSWPEDLRKRVKSYRTLPGDKRKAFLQELAVAEKGEALPFLWLRLRGGEADADAAHDMILGMMDNAEMREWITSRIREPGNPMEGKLLTKILLREDAALQDIAPMLSSPHLAPRNKEELIQHAVQRLVALLKQEKYAELETQASRFTEAEPNELRFGYLRAIALAHLGREEESTALCVKTHSHDPKSETAHYHAADLLEDLHQLDLALGEWRRVLKTPSDEEIYDITAHMRLGRIYALKESYSLAADSYETGLRMYRKARANGKGAFVMNSTEAELEERIAKLREKSLEKRKTQEGVTIRVSPSIKKDGAAELARLRKLAECRITMTIQPYGERFFDNANATLAYDAGEKKLQVLLNGNPGPQTVRATFKSEKPLVAVETLDMWYFYELNLAENSSRLVASFEVDYVLHFEPSPRLAAWDSPGMSLNGTPHTWKALEDGIPFDFLPETLIMDVKGRTPEGKESDLRLETDADRLRRMQDKR
jgi:tetratricopeptide (TPR) repeat protein